MRRKNKGFTLIELLVVIAIIAVLMGILMPALSRIRNQAKGVMCMTYLKQWGTMFKMYCDDNNSMFPTRNLEGDDAGKGRWMYALRDYYKDAKDLKLCPMVKKSSAEMWDSDQMWGSTIYAWQVTANEVTGGRELGTYGSYGINGWVYKPYKNEDYINGLAVAAWHWKTSDSKGASQIPLMMDAMFWTGWPREDNEPREEELINPERINDEDGMQRYCLDRHNQRINAVFMDYSVRSVGLKELWTLQWHKRYNVAGPWTKAGGAQPEDWPDWMKQMKDY